LVFSKPFSNPALISNNASAAGRQLAFLLTQLLPS